MLKGEGQGNVADTLSVPQFSSAIDAGYLWRGDHVGVAYAEPTLVQRLIARIQRRLLVDLLEGSDEPEAVREMAATYAERTHSRMILSWRLCGEMTSPKARGALWGDVLHPGDRLIVTRPIGATREQLEAAAAVMRRICAAAQPYPTRELLHYYVWSWRIRKLAWGERFLSVFADRTCDVCSGSVWRCWLQAGAVHPAGADRYGEAWYPARLSMPGEHIQAIAEVEIVGGGATPATPGRGVGATPRTPLSAGAGACG